MPIGYPLAEYGGIQWNQNTPSIPWYKFCRESTSDP